jgi:hypothetical protein
VPVSYIAGFLFLHAFLQDTSALTADYDVRFPVELTGEIADDADGTALMEALDWIRLHPYDLNRHTVGEALSIRRSGRSGVQGKGGEVQLRAGSPDDSRGKRRSVRCPGAVRVYPPEFRSRPAGFAPGAGALRVSPRFRESGIAA